MAGKIDELLSKNPFLPNVEQRSFFKEAMQEALFFHQQNSDFYRAFLKANNFSEGEDWAVEKIPPLPIGIFKERVLRSVPEAEIVKVTHSSATTSGKPSTILIDDITRSRQRLSLAKIMGAVLGKERKPFIIFDSQETLDSAGGELSSRATTIRGLLSFSSKFFCVLNSSLRFDAALFDKALGELREQEAVVFGVTTVLYDTLLKYKGDAAMRVRMKNLHSPWILLSGGWKKLASLNMDQENFKKDLVDFFSTSRSKVIDFYGMIEQTGIIYPECAKGYKHIPVYAAVIMRDLKTMQPLGFGQEGMIEVLTPLPHSYPGIALLTDDLGRMEGLDGCACGLAGPFFSFVSRAPQAEAKGCADTLSIPED